MMFMGEIKIATLDNIVDLNHIQSLGMFNLCSVYVRLIYDKPLL